MTKLYEVPHNSKIRVLEETSTPPGGIPAKGEGEILNFLHIDGMYSYCTNDKGQVVHLAAWTEVEVLPVEQLSDGMS